MTSSIKILTTASLDSSPTVVLIAPNGSRILIDCGEGCQRACLEHNQRLSTVGSICLTSLQVSSTGGLPGLILTAADVQQMAAATAAAKLKVALVSKPIPHKEDDMAMEDNETTAIVQSKTSQSTTSKGNTHRTKNNLSLWPFRSVDDDGKSPSTVKTLQITGPKGTRAYIQSLRHFIRRRNFPVVVREGSTQGELNASQDSAGGSVTSNSNGTKKKRKKSQASQADPQKVNFSYQSIAFDEDENDASIQQQDGDATPNDMSSRKRPRTINNVDDEHSSAPAVETTPSALCHPSLISYLFTTPPLPGKFLIDRAQQLGVPRGPLYGKLKAGQSVTFQKVPTTANASDASTVEEVTVHSADVVMPPQPGIGVLVLRYPTRVESLERFWDHMDLGKLLRSSTHKVHLEVVLHIASRAVYEHAASASWREQTQNQTSKEGDTIEHIWVDTDTSSDVYGTPHLSAAQTARMRNLVCPSIYQVPSRPTTDLSSQVSNNTSHVTAFPSLEYQLLPRSKRGFFPSLDTDPLVARNEMLQSEEADLLKDVEETGAIQLAHQIQDNSSVGASNGSSSREGRIIFTGTASAIPCKHRNVSGICLSSTDERAILLDVGEGTVGQLLRTPTWIPEEEKDLSVGESLSRIKAVWISHPHADHHLGLLRLLHERNCQNDQLLIIAPRPIFEFLEEYQCIHPFIAGTYFGIDCRDFTSPNPAGNKLLAQAVGVSNCRAVRVTHCPLSYAVILDGTCYGRLVYSGDCRPCDYLSKVARGADVLIHEATFEDGMESEAAVKRHCTVGEALRIAHQMQAKSTILTHFSQRYPKIPPAPEAEKATNSENADSSMPVVFAFDFMTLSKRNIPLAAKLTEALRLLYPPEEEDNDNDLVDSELLESGLQMAKDAMSVPGLFAQNDLL